MGDESALLAESNVAQLSAGAVHHERSPTFSLSKESATGSSQDAVLFPKDELCFYALAVA